MQRQQSAREKRDGDQDAHVYLPSVAFTAITTGPSAFRLATHPVPDTRRTSRNLVQQLPEISDAVRLFMAAPHRVHAVALAAPTRAHLLLLVQPLKLSGRYAYMMCIFAN
jgi:hypothetical protein